MRNKHISWETVVKVIKRTPTPDEPLITRESRLEKLEEMLKVKREGGGHFTETLLFGLIYVGKGMLWVLRVDQKAKLHMVPHKIE